MSSLFEAWAEENAVNAMTPDPPRRAGYIPVSIHVDGLTLSDSMDVLDAAKTRQALHALTDRTYAMLRAREG